MFQLNHVLVGVLRVQLQDPCDTTTFFSFCLLHLSMFLLSASYQTTKLLWYPPWQIALSADESVGTNENMTFLRRVTHRAKLEATLIVFDKSPRKRILHACTETYLGIHWSTAIKTWEDKEGQWSGKRAPLGLFYSSAEEGAGGWGASRAADWLTRPINGAQTSGLMVDREIDWLDDWQRRAGAERRREEDGGGGWQRQWGIKCTLCLQAARNDVWSGKADLVNEDIIQCLWTRMSQILSWTNINVHLDMNVILLLKWHFV